MTRQTPLKPCKYKIQSNAEGNEVQLRTTEISWYTTETLSCDGTAEKPEIPVVRPKHNFLRNPKTKDTVREKDFP